MNSASIEKRTPEARLASRGWRLRHSAWLLAPIIGLGWFSFIGFVYVAARIRQRRWWIIAAVFTAGSALSMTMMEVGTHNPSLSGIGPVITMIVWGATIVYGLVLNRDYLRWRAGQSSANAWYLQQQPMQDRYVQQQPPVQLNMPTNQPPPVLGINTSAYYAPAPEQNGPTSWPPPTPPTPQVPPALPCDLNTAAETQIAALPGMTPEIAARTVAERSQRGGFVGLDDFAQAVGVQPHQLVKVREHVRFSPRPTQQAPQNQRPSGRILDI